MAGTDEPIAWRERPAWVRALPLAGVALVNLVQWVFGLPAWHAVVATPVVLTATVVRSMRQRAMVVGFMLVGVVAGYLTFKLFISH